MERAGWSAPENMAVTGTVYLRGDDAREFERSGYCEGCLRPASEWAESDRFGNYEVHGDFDSRDNLAGFLCPQCAEVD
ncbi:hypothetical protein [Desulfofundulus thermosubterraneus]|uniref:Uncharacterized protein n=1 Tax=Desulfofundulus thermosubterraneus DSM 16057 TaxID=1121432 RepID=A0A1M6EU42_9FIRM|nr:hypothetical protein [Desulfofundulus thermosubterraneus]SHI88928.1 hypothetical protein SAMN02745219_01278 [Desulfofundulus thermosubterraneus DSM 16057]